MPFPKLLTAFGKTQSMADWAREKAIPYTILKDRMRQGWPVEEALTRAANDGKAKPRATAGQSDNGKGQKRFSAYVGETIGRLRIDKYVPGVKLDGTRPVYVCTCTCGTVKTVSPYSLVYGGVESCGCWASERMAATNVERSVHGMCGTPEYAVWQAMLDRCRNENSRVYADYGGRGIDVCESWKTSFENFITDMGRRPVGALTLERVDNNKGYGPDNCVWATYKVQGNNKRNTVRVTAYGKTQTVRQWADETGLEYQTIYSRLRCGWDPEQAVSEGKHA